MVLAKSKNTVGLGNSLMNDRFGKGRKSEMHRGNQPGIQRQGADGSTYVTNNKKDAAWVKMQSRTEQSDLDEFLSTAELAGTDFTAEKLNNVKIIHTDQKNPFLLSALEERATVKKHQENKKSLTVPRRPPWNEDTTAQELDERERESLLEWRRGLAHLQENQDLLMTPFERNLEVWRQLWRVIERSDLVVQIVDARNPLLFRSEDLEKYVKEVDSRKRNLLLVNKADMMTEEQRSAWASYFIAKDINYKFFSASLAKEINEARDLEDSEDMADGDDIDKDNAVHEDEVDQPIEREADNDPIAQEERKIHQQEAKDDEQEWVSEEEIDTQEDRLDHALSDDHATRILTTDELEALFLQHAPEINIDPDSPPRKTQIGLVGYPNVGKSSTINALIGAKKVSVSATPGKTKHFQTIHLSSKVVLCDCPGLVFPNFATTKAELVVNGILPIDQLREYTGPSALVAQRIPKSFLEAIYGMKIETRPIEEGGTGTPTAEELLRAYARARGFSTQGQGQPDESRAARYVLKDYVKGKLLFCHPPPADPPINEKGFNRELYDEQHLPLKRRAALAIQEEAEALNKDDPSLMDDEDVVPLPPIHGEKSQNLDRKFFAPGQGHNAHMSVPASFGFKSSGDLSGRKQKAMIALEKDINPAEVRMGTGKKHYKGNKRRGKKAGYE